MLDLLLLPFRLMWSLLEMVFGLVTGAFEFVFGLLGGLLELGLTIAGLAIFIGFISLAVHRRRSYRAHKEDFTSFYDQDGKVE